MTRTTDGCAEHGEMGEELRLLALALLDRFEPGVRSVLAGLRVEAAEAAAVADDRPAACQWCPLCSVIAVLRGDRPELGGRVAEHAAALLTALRAVLEQPSPEQPSPEQPSPEQPSPEPRRPRVQRIEVQPATGDSSHGDPRHRGADGGC